MYLKGSGRCLIKLLNQDFSGGLRKSAKNLRITCVSVEIEAKSSRIRFRQLLILRLANDSIVK